MHLRGSILLFPFNALVGHDAMQTFLHHDGHLVSIVGLSGVYSLSITTAIGRVHDPALATLFE